MKMTPTEMRLFKEKIIKEYKLKHEKPQKQSLFDRFVKISKKLIPVNIIVGLAACFGVYYFNGFQSLVYLLLTGVIWVTLFSTVISAMVRN